MKRKQFALMFALLMVLSLGTISHGKSTTQVQRFADQIGQVQIGDVQDTKIIQLPFIFWGGDMATFYANGGLKTKPGTIFDKQGLNFNLVPGDDFPAQVKDYLSGKSPFLRGTVSMIAMASEVIGADPRTKGVEILQMTWSKGDHLVGRSNIKTISDLKGKTIVLQAGGPHVGMLDTLLKQAGINWKDITVKWAKDITGTADSPGAIFKADTTVDACFVVTPDMIGLTGGLAYTGNGSEGTVKGARVVVSTAEMTYEIADVYVVRKDFYDAHKDLVTKFVAGYLKAREEVIDLKKQYEAKGSPKYTELLKMSQTIFGNTAIPTLDDAHGLLSDCAFVGHPGNIAYFTDKNNLHGFDPLQKSALDMATTLGYATNRFAVLPSGLDYNSPAFTKYLTKVEVKKADKFKAEAVKGEIESFDSLDDKTIYSFTIQFKPNQTDFTAEQYGAEFQKVVELADKYGGAVIAIRGHADPSETLKQLVKAGLAKGTLQKTGTAPNIKYSFNGKPLDLTATADVVKQIEAGAFDGVADNNPRETMQAALNLSKKRADTVRDSIISYAGTQNIKIDKSQIQAVGIGIREPFIAKPKDMSEAEQNMRVEFSLVRVKAEAQSAKDFDY